MLHEILPHRFNNQFVVSTGIAEEDYIFHYKDNSLLVKINGDGFECPRKKEITEIANTTESVFLFSLNEVRCFLIWEDPLILNEPFSYKEISFFRTLNPPEIAWAGIVGFQLRNWYLRHKFCGKCGSETEVKPDERAILCPACHTLIFPEIPPAIIVAITCNDKILLAHNSNFQQNWYSLVAGYVEIGESLEETVKREVKEEVGLDVWNVRYYKSQPWPFSGSMMIGFFAEADDTQPVRPDCVEITDAAWYTRGNLPNHPPTISIAGEMIEQFEKGKI